jgi:hypothetical protein
MDFHRFHKRDLEGFLVFKKGLSRTVDGANSLTD